MGTGTLGQFICVEQGFQFISWNLEQTGRLEDQVDQLWIGQAVENETSLTSRIDQVGVSHLHQLLGDVSLAHVQQCFQVADAGFTIPDCSQDLNPGWGAEGAKDSAEFFVRGGFCCIHNYEYILLYIRIFEYDIHPV